MNTNVSESGSLYGKMMAILIAALFALSSFTAMVSASDDEEEEHTDIGSINMMCEWNKRTMRWIPLSIAPEGTTPVPLQEAKAIEGRHTRPLQNHNNFTPPHSAQGTRAGGWWLLTPHDAGRLIG